jgi:hypothetical protein
LVAAAGATVFIRLLDPAEDPDPDPCRDVGGEGRGSFLFRVNERFGLNCVVYGEGDRGERLGENGDEGLGEIWYVSG